MIGIHPNLSNEDYHGHKESYSRSALMEFKKSPYRYWANYLNPDKPTREVTEAMIFGSAFHEFILEHELFYSHYAAIPMDIDRRTKKGKEAYEDFLKEGKQLFTYKQMEQLNSMRNALGKHSKAMQLIEGATYEQSYFWTDPESELIVKARPDILHTNMIVDLKTCADASPRAFQRAMVDGGYHMQGAMIRDAVRTLEGRDISAVINIAIEKIYPFSIGIYIIDEYALDAGEAEYKAILLSLKHAIAYNEFPGYEVQTVSLPAWAL